MSGPEGRSRRLTGRGTPLAERLVGALLAVCSGLSVLVTFGIVGVLAWETVGFFGEVSLGAFLGSTEWSPLHADPSFGVWPLVAGTLLTTGIAAVVALPLGLMAAIHLAELTSWRMRAWLKPALEILAGVPTIVYGYFALVLVTPALKAVIPGLSGYNALSPGIVMGLMILPMVASLSEDALRAVPRPLKEGAYALGARRATVIRRVTLPTAASGIGASVVLALSRALGETMIVAVAAGQQARFTADPRVPIQTMTAYIVQVSMGDVPTGTTPYRTIFAVGTLLFLMTLAMNALGQRLRRRFRGAGP